jgi:hypothetical protein
LSDGQAREESGDVKKVGGVDIIDVTGFYKFKGDDGKIYIVEYSANESGYTAKVDGL